MQVTNRSFTFVRTWSLRHMRHLGSRWNPLAPGANSIDSTDSSTTQRNASDTDMVSSSNLRTCTVIDGSILPERDLLRDKGITTNPGQCQVKSAQNPSNFGVPNSGVSAVLTYIWNTR